MKFYRIKRIIVLEDGRTIFIMKNGDEIARDAKSTYRNQIGESFNYLFDERTGEIVGFTEKITIEIEE